jgi:hypothetical protein
MPFAGKVITRFAVGTLAELTGSCQVFTAFFSPSKPGKLIWGAVQSLDPIAFQQTEENKTVNDEES